MFVMVMCLGDGREMTAATAAKAAAGSGLSAVGCSRSAAAMMMLTNGGVQYGFPPVYWEEPSCGQCVCVCVCVCIWPSLYLDVLGGLGLGVLACVCMCVY